MLVDPSCKPKSQEEATQNLQNLGQLWQNTNWDVLRVQQPMKKAIIFLVYPRPGQGDQSPPPQTSLTSEGVLGRGVEELLEPVWGWIQATLAGNLVTGMWIH